MFRVTAFTTGCFPTRSAEAKDWSDALAQALVDVDHLHERAFGAADFSQIEGTQGEYSKLKSVIKRSDRPAIGHHVQFGPLPDGYHIKIENLAGD